MGIAAKAALGRASRSEAARVCLGLALLLVVCGEAAAMATATDARASQPGLAMRDALEAQARGETERAAQLLAELRAREPLVGDYADLLRMRMWVAAERWEDAVALGHSWDHPASPVEAEFREHFGRALAARGDERAARAQWIAALARTDDGERLATLRLEIARSELRTGNERGAAETFLEIFTRHPGTPADAEASAALDALDRRIGPLRHAKQLRRRGDTLFAQRRNDEALAAYDAALAQGGGSEKDAAKIRQKRAHTLFRLRRYPEAVLAFSSYPAGTSDRIEQARAVARAGDVPGALRELEPIAAGSSGADATQARLLAALLLDGEGQAEQARRHYLELVRTAPRSAAGLTAIWQLGWEAYRAGNHRAAIGYFDKLAPLESDEMSRLRARYWSARAREKEGDAARAQEAFAALALEYPLSYYGWRAAARLDGRKSPGGPEVPAVSAAPLPRGRAVLEPRELERPRILLEAGLGDLARLELDGLFGRARGLDDRLALAELYADAGEFNRPQRLVVDAYQETLARAPLPESLELWWHAWPAPFFDEVRDATAHRAHVDPALVYAIMREESGYRPEVLSVSGARGLLQLMPETAEKVAFSEAMTGFAADDLFVPRINIALGSAYLEELFARFGGRPSAAIGSYNAGPHRVAQWLDGNELEDDEWVEAIPYDQTRAYVKRVLRSMRAYRVLY
jgi:soluble lytic murein transglycosylase